MAATQRFTEDVIIGLKRALARNTDGNAHSLSTIKSSYSHLPFQARIPKTLLNTPQIEEINSSAKLDTSNAAG